MKLHHFLFSVCLLAAGCLAPPAEPTGHTLVVADYGRIPVNPHDQIKAWARTNLRDSLTARIEDDGVPVKGWVTEARIMGGATRYGWIVSARINATNGFGGYTGFQDRLFFFDGTTGALTHELTTERHDELIAGYGRAYY